MTKVRCLFSLAVALGFLYAIGGQDCGTSLKWVKRYDPDADEWEQVESLNIPLSSAAFAVCRKFIYIIGGSKKINCKETVTVECFDGHS